jgi:hypothetical protein
MNQYLRATKDNRAFSVRAGEYLKVARTVSETSSMMGLKYVCLGYVVYYSSGAKVNCL